MELRLMFATGSLLVTYVLIVLRGVVRRVDIQPWLAMLIGAALMIALGVVTPSEAIESVNVEVLVFLFSLFTIASALEVSGFLSYVAYRLVSSTRKMYSLIGKVFFSSAVLSMFISNDGLSATFTPIMVENGRIARNLDVKPLLYALAYGVTVGSVMLPIGNPQNLLIALESGMPKPFLNFVKYLALPTLLNLAATYLLLILLFRGSAMDDVVVKEYVKAMSIKDRRLAYFTIATLAVIVAALFIGDLVGLNFNPALVALIGATAVYVAAGGSRVDVLANVDWQTIVFFMGLFIVSEGVSVSGLLNIIASLLPSPATLFGIFTSSILLSQVISNVPMVALYLPLLRSLGVSSGNVKDWVALAASSTIAGNLTLLGAASNIIISQASEKRGGPGFSYIEFLKYGLAVTAVNVVIYYVFLRFT